MSSQDNKSKSPQGEEDLVKRASEEKRVGRDASAHLAHELANLLDGSMRNLSLALKEIANHANDVPPPPMHTYHDGDGIEIAATEGDVTQTAATERLALSSASADNVLHKLQTASSAMHQMACLIHQWMRTPNSQRDSLRWLSQDPSAIDVGVLRAASSPRTIIQSVDLLRDLFDYAISGLRLELHIDITEHAAILPAGPLFQVLENLVRNSIEAFSTMTADQMQGCNQIAICALVEDDELKLRLSDTASGLADEMLSSDGQVRFGKTTKTYGHGLGLALTHDLIAQMGGEIELLPNTPSGTVVKINVPRSSLLGQVK
ncbi:ATP-binding protein [Poriferisphaera sp. WC338]|uniref:ATP-binding protein n=1 Tax=Poriferisphaera sp. WC338 TaxID=3425129 RepID=UPI003D81624F